MCVYRFDLFETLTIQYFRIHNQNHCRGLLWCRRVVRWMSFRMESQFFYCWRLQCLDSFHQIMTLCSGMELTQWELLHLHWTLSLPINKLRYFLPLSTTFFVYGCLTNAWNSSALLFDWTYLSIATHPIEYGDKVILYCVYRFICHTLIPCQNYISPQFDYGCYHNTNNFWFLFPFV